MCSHLCLPFVFYKIKKSLMIIQRLEAENYFARHSAAYWPQKVYFAAFQPSRKAYLSSIYPDAYEKRFSDPSPKKLSSYVQFKKLNYHRQVKKIKFWFFILFIIPYLNSNRFFRGWASTHPPNKSVIFIRKNNAVCYFFNFARGCDSS